jgi:8-amino-7-oxononanoate synthase
METEIEKKIKEIMKIVREKKLYPDIKVIEKGVPSEPEFVVKGKKVLSFCSANYLGLANDQRIKKAIIEGLFQYGIHPSASPLVSGTLTIHKELEKEIASFIGYEDAMLFGKSTLANMGVIPALINLPVTTFLSSLKIPFLKKEGGDAVLFSDELNHATVIEGCRLAKAERVIYKHCDMNDLENKLKKYQKKKKKLILSDGVFTMDGDIAPLPDIVDLAQKYGAMVFMDDVGGTGILGEEGKGTMEYFGLKDGVDVIVTNFAKAFGVDGGAAIASKEIIDYLRISAKTYIFTGAFLSALACGVLKALEIIKTERWRHKKLWENTKYLKNKLQEAGFNTLNSQTPIIPVLIGDEKIIIQMAKDLFNQGIFSAPYYWPAVPKGQAKFRFTVTCQYQKEQINILIEKLVEVGKKYKIINY